MNVTLSGEVAEYVRRKVASGDYPSADEVVRDALQLLREQDEERRKLAALRQDVAVGLRELDAGLGEPVDVMILLAEVRAARAAKEG